MKESTQQKFGMLVDMDCFEFHGYDYDPATGYQKTKLMLICTVKQDLRRKVRLIDGGHLINLLDYDIYSSTVKGVSVNLLQVIAHSVKLDSMCKDILQHICKCIYKLEIIYLCRPRIWCK